VSVEAPVVPALHACVTCGLHVQGGEDPGGLAWHDCEQVLELKAAALPPPPKPPGGVESLLDLLTSSLAARVDRISPREAAEVLDAMARFEAARAKREGGGDGSSLAQQLQHLIAEAE
jgi:hypothetical protein